MDFSSNWSQPRNSNHQLQESSNIISRHGLVLNHHQLSQNPNPNPNPNHHATSSGTSLPARLGGGSMVEKARQAKLPPPEGTLNCPRCDSTNTKFCYYNNYNFTQPRYFCKGCRRYWTRGGTLRNVPVGGGCRKNNKKGKNGNSKSKQTSSSSLGNTPSPSLGQIMNRANQQFLFQSQSHNYNLTQLGGIGLNLSSTNGNNQTHNNNITSSLFNELGFVNNYNENNNLMASVGSMSHHFTLFDPTTTGIYSFQNEGNIGISSSSAGSMVDSMVYNQKDPVKMEEDKTGLANLSKPENQYFWTGSDFSGPHFL